MKRHHESRAVACKRECTVCSTCLSRHKAWVDIPSPTKPHETPSVVGLQFFCPRSSLT